MLAHKGDVRFWFMYRHTVKIYLYFDISRCMLSLCHSNDDLHQHQPTENKNIYIGGIVNLFTTFCVHGSEYCK